MSEPQRDPEQIGFAREEIPHDTNEMAGVREQQGIHVVCEVGKVHHVSCNKSCFHES